MAQLALNIKEIYSREIEIRSGRYVPERRYVRLSAMAALSALALRGGGTLGVNPRKRKPQAES